MSALVATQVDGLAKNLGLLNVDSKDLVETLKSTAFKGNVTDEQMAALLMVANQYGLNPWTKEIYAFPDKGGIVPVVGVDGWSRIINGHAQFDGIDFEQDDKSCTCIIYRKDRSHPIRVTEWMAECKRSNAGPWQSHPRRMLRHKAMIQCSRIAFGFVGIYDQDEAERITVSQTDSAPQRTERIAQEMPTYSDDEFNKNFGTWSERIKSGRKSADEVIAMVQTKYTLTPGQMGAIRDLETTEAEVVE